MGHWTFSQRAARKTLAGILRGRALIPTSRRLGVTDLEVGAGQGEDLGAVVGDDEGVLELGHA